MFYGLPPKRPKYETKIRERYIFLTVASAHPPPELHSVAMGTAWASCLEILADAIADSIKSRTFDAKSISLRYP